MNTTQQKKGLDISAKSFVTAIAVLLALMCVTYALTWIIPGGSYDRITDEAGNLKIDPNGEFTHVDGGIPLWKWLLSPLLVLGAEGNVTIITVIIFLLVIGGIFNALSKGGLMQYMLERIVAKFKHARYRLQAVVALFFMAMGAFIGSFEECVPLVPLVVALSVKLGWDAITGLSISVLAAGCGFAAGVCNPFTIGLAQEVAGLPVFSGIWLRLLSFALIYALLMLFIRKHSKKIESDAFVAVESAGEIRPEFSRGLICFASILGAGILLVLSSVFIPALQDYTMVIVAVMFLIAGIIAVLVSGMSAKELGAHFINGSVSILPAVLMILLASSIKYTMEEANILDTILHEAVDLAGTLPTWLVVLFIYFIVLFMNFFISSGSAKVFLLMPLIVPMAEIFGISAQLSIVAFAFGDGFSNVFYPTNPVLLISLGLANVSYGKWVRESGKFQIANLILTSLILILGFVIGY